jgi:hypothetical protein
MKKGTVLSACLCLSLPLLTATPVHAKEPTAAAAQSKATSDATQANNPLADFTALNIHNYYIPELTDSDGDSANTAWLRYAQPFGKWLFRGSLPVSRVPTIDGGSTSGMGDLNAFAAYLFDTGDPARSFGLGPQLTLPTATDDALGTGKYQLGFAAVYFDASSTIFQWGGLVTWQTDIAGDSDRDDTSLLAVQPFYFFQLGKGLYLRGAPIWVFNLENDSYNVPVALGIGKVFKSGKTVYNAFIEPQFSIMTKGPGQPEFQLFMGFNMQFK